MKRTFMLLALFLSMFLLTGFDGCFESTPPKSSSGVQKATVQVQTDQAGLTVEQKNVMERLKTDNKPGSLKHLYVMSAYSGQVLIYSTVKGKVTSSGKRLSPTTVAANDAQYSGGIPVDLGGITYRTGEVLQDDGTYGTSVEYIFWYDTKGNYHQQYITGGMIVHVSDVPLAVKGVVLNMELTTAPKEEVK